MKTELLAVALTTLAWLGLAIVFAGIGSAVRRLFGVRGVDGSAALMAPWLGWGVALALLQVWHLWLPVNGLALALIAALGGAGLLVTGRDWAAWLRAKPGAGWGGLAAVVVVGLWLANQTTTQPGIYDSGLYHLNSIRWAAEYPIVPGIGNLHARLAFNSPYFLYAALLDRGFFHERSHHVVSGFLILLALGRCLHAAASVFARRDRPPSLPALFDTLFLVPLIAWTVNTGYASSPSPDVGVFLIGFLIASELLALYAPRAATATNGSRGRSPSTGPDEPDGVSPSGKSDWRASVPASRRSGGAEGLPGVQAYRAWTVAFLAAVGVAVKLNFAPYAAVAGLLAFMAARANPPLRTWLAWTAAAALLLLGPWVVRGIIQSGYPAYPAPYLGLDVDWRVPLAHARYYADVIKAYARNPDLPCEQVLGNWKWLWPWFNVVLRQYRFDVVLPLALAAAGAVGGSWVRRQGPRPAAPRFPAILAALPLAALVFWFVSVPDPRYAGPAFWVLGLGAVTWALAGLDRRAAQLAILGFAVTLAALTLNPLECLRPWRKNPGPARRAPLKEGVTESGLKLWTPVTGDQCWNAPLPCTPYPNPKLRLRVQGDMSKGFTMEGVP